MQKQFIYQHEDTEYIVNVTFKVGMRYIRYYFRDGQFKVSCPYLVTIKKIKDGLDKFYDSLMAKNTSLKAEGDDFIYLLGYRYKIQQTGAIPLNNGDSITYKSHDELKKKLFKWFKEYLKYRTEYYEKMMNIPLYQVKLRKMKSRYGSNSVGTHTISFSTILIHYSSEIIDAIIVHELAHHFERNHHENFYKVVYQYCPDYKNLHKKLRKGEFR